jgi:hypothetical protein
LHWLAETIAALPAPDPPADFAAQVRVRLAARQAARAAAWPRRWAFGFAAAVAAGGALVSLAYFLPPVALPWTGWTMEMAPLQATLEATVADAVDACHYAPLWWQQTWAAAPGFLAVVGDTLGRAPASPWWNALMRGLWVALGLALAGNALNHLCQRRVAVRGS